MGATPRLENSKIVPPKKTERVIIIGAGPVGQTAALLLAKWGIPTSIVDSHQSRDLIGSKAICQQRDVLDIWDCIGAGSIIAQEGVTWTTSRTFFGSDELICTTFQDRGQSCFPPFVNISQSRTEQILDEFIAKNPLIEMRWGHKVIDLIQTSQFVELVCETKNGNVSLKGEYVIAAPGSKGEIIRDKLGISFEGKSFDDKFLICDIQTELPGWQNERRFYFEPEWNPGRQVLIHPCPNHTFRIDWQVPHDFDLQEEAASGALDSRIRKIIGENDYTIVWKSLYRFHSRLTNKMRVGRVLLAGDVAHLFAPFGARGLNSGIFDAENAAWKLAFVLNGWATADILESYHVERHLAALENLEITSNTMDFLIPTTESTKHRRHQILTMAKSDPDARSKVDSGRLAEPFWYPNSPLTISSRSHPFPGRPAKGDVPPPCPGVLVPDTPLASDEFPGITRLRQLLRRGITVLLGENIDKSEVDLVCKGIDAPINIYRFQDFKEGEKISNLLGATADEIWIIRPDAYVAAILEHTDNDHLYSCIDNLFALRKH